MTNSALRKRGSLIVAVLVVLFLVVLMSTQTFQTLLLVRQGDSRQNALRQARELIELGRMIRQQHPQATKFAPAKLSFSENLNGVILIEMQNPAEAQQGQVAGTDATAVTVEDNSPTSVGPVTPQRYRIVATFRAGTKGEVTATWEGMD